MIIIGNYWLLAVACCLSVWGLLFFLILWRCCVLPLCHWSVCVSAMHGFFFILRKTSGTHAYFNRKNEHLNGTKQNASRTELRDIEKRSSHRVREKESVRAQHALPYPSWCAVHVYLYLKCQTKKECKIRVSQHVIVCVVDCVLLVIPYMRYETRLLFHFVWLYNLTLEYRFIQCIRRYTQHIVTSPRPANCYSL